MNAETVLDCIIWRGEHCIILPPLNDNESLKVDIDKLYQEEGKRRRSCYLSNFAPMRFPAIEIRPIRPKNSKSPSKKKSRRGL